MDYDAIVVGAGHNGLTAAVILQRAGLRTLCLEANTYSGGMAATVELTELKPPGPDEVHAAIRESVHSHLGAACVS